MKLYSAPRTRSVRPRWLLEELGVPYELVKLDLSKQEHKAPAYLAVNPLGELPALQDGAVTLFNTLAICLYLADRFPEKHLAPPPNAAERGPYLQWISFAEGNLDAAVMDVYGHAQLPEEEKKARGPDALARLQARMNEVLNIIDGALGGRDFLVGDHFTAADLSMSSILHLANTLKLLEKHPRLVAYTHLHAQRPAVRRALAP